MRRYMYRVEFLEEPAEGQTFPGGRFHYLSRSAAVHRVNVLADHGIRAEVQRSSPVTWPDYGDVS